MNYTDTFEQIEQTSLKPWLDRLPKQIESGFDVSRWGDLPKWEEVLQKLPKIQPSSIDLNSDYITIGNENDCDTDTREQLQTLLKEYHPWRKGPFNVFGIEIETEWRCDMKWNRLKDHIAPLKNRLILDVGSGNGYYCLRMAGQDARLAIGIDPTPLYVLQFQAMQSFINEPSASIVPLGIDSMPDSLDCFDTVFSMGLLYHRRAPLDHLLKLKSFLREGGELVIETLVIDGKVGDVLCPEGRYAKMPNVWFIPTTSTLEHWLKRMGFENIRLIDVTKTTPEEQRVTEWMGFQSLADFLKTDDPNLTVEGYPAPKRAIFIANNP